MTKPACLIAGYYSFRLPAQCGNRHSVADAIIEKRGILNLEEGARKFARRLSREKGKQIKDAFLYTAFARKGWMVPNQYWTPGVLSPMAIMGKYYMVYGKELSLDNLGFCRVHRLWAEEICPR
jgi:glyceraldehyde-3-phosphate dehydrogenase (ferredoxin)